MDPLPTLRPLMPKPRRPQKRQRSPEIKRQQTLNASNSAALAAWNNSPEHNARFRASIEKMRAEGRFPTRQGSRVGYRGVSGRARWRAIEAAAAQEAKLIMDQLIEEGRVDKDAAGNEALQFAIQVVRGREMGENNLPAYKPAERLSAAKLVLEFTMEKPTMKNEHKVDAAEDFLTAVLAKTGSKA